MGVEFDFPQNADPSRFSVADWSRASRKARTSPSNASVTPAALAPDTTAYITGTADAAATAKADAAKAAAIAESGATAETLAASAEANAISAGADALAAHVAAADPHPGYLTQPEGDARYPHGPLSDFADDTAAAGGGIAVGSFYRTGSAVKIRVT